MKGIVINQTFQLRVDTRRVRDWTGKGWMYETCLFLRSDTGEHIGSRVTNVCRTARAARKGHAEFVASLTRE